VKPLLISVVCLAAGASLAHAQVSAVAQSEALFRQGKELMEQGKFAEACVAFDAGQKLDPQITGLLIDASCHEKANQLATAWGLFVEAERQTRNATDDVGKQYHDTAQQHAARIEPRLSTLTIKVDPTNKVGGLEILQDVTPVDPGAWNKALPIDGGTYKITARAPGNPEWSSSVTVGNEHDAKTLEIPKLTAAVLDRTKLKDHDDEPKDTGPTRHREFTPVTIGLGAGGIAVLGGALAFDLWGDSTYNSAKAEPNDAKQLDLWHSANTKRYVAEGMLVGGIAAIGVAVYFYLHGVEEDPAAHSTAKLFIAPTVASSGASSGPGFQLAGWF
jgi:hypothetical protein